MRKQGMLLALLLALLLTACGQKGPLYIPPAQQSPASATPDLGPTTADDLNRELDEAEEPPAETQDDQTLDDPVEPESDDDIEG